ncbi:MAG: polysaccharide pyruvyl transferase family protein [Ruminococcus sp.]
MLQYTSMHKAVEYCTEGRYDVGMLGVWFGCNYGSIATYYGLMKQLQGLGLSVLMIDKPGYTDEDRELSGENHSRIFANSHFHVSRKYALSEMHLLNHKCDSFVIGSDQVWNYGICRNFGRSFLMDFVRDEKKKVAVAVSFGHGKDFRPERERLVSAEYLKRFDAISVRKPRQLIFWIKPSECLLFVFWIPFFPQTEVSMMRSQRNLQGEKQNRIFLPIFWIRLRRKKRRSVFFLKNWDCGQCISWTERHWNYESNKEKMGMDGILKM